MIWVWEYCFAGNFATALAFFFCAGMLFASAAVAVHTERSSIYVGTAIALVGGVGCGVALGWLSYVPFCYSVLTLGGGVTYLFILLIIEQRRHKRARKKAEQERAKRLEFALPNRENSFIRARLQAAMQHASEEEKTAVDFQLCYAQKCIAALKSAHLSIIDRMRIEETEKILAAYAKKQDWTVGDVRALNDTFSALLKQSAKYTLTLKNGKEQETKLSG